MFVFFSHRISFDIVMYVSIFYKTIRLYLTIFQVSKIDNFEIEFSY